jgi:hypothetical protein
MVLNTEPGTEWDATVAAFCGAVLGAVAVVVHQLYVALFVDYLIVLGFKRSSQHPEGGVCDEHSKAAVGSVWTSPVAVTGPSTCGRT